MTLTKKKMSISKICANVLMNICCETSTLALLQKPASQDFLWARSIYIQPKHWVWKAASYNFSILYILGNKNVADILGRQPLIKKPCEWEIVKRTWWSFACWHTADWRWPYTLCQQVRPLRQDHDIGFCSFCNEKLAAVLDVQTERELGENNCLAYLRRS